MRVLFLTSVYPSSDNPVPGIFIQRIADALSGLDVVVTVIHPVPWMPLPARYIPPQWQYYKNLPVEEVSESGVRVLRPRYISYPKSAVWGFDHHLISYTVRRMMVAKDVHPDIVHAHFGYPMGHVAMSLKQALNVPYVCTVRGDDVNVLPQTSFLYKRRLMRVLRGADLVTAVSRTLSEKAEGLSGESVCTLYNGVKLDDSATTLSKSEARGRLNLDGNSFYVLYVGALTERKGINELFEVIESNNDSNIKYIIMGSAINSSERITIPPSCTHIEWQHQDVVWQYMAAADMLILPTYSEGMPNVVVEAAALGLPVVATSVGGIPEIINGDTGKLIEPRSSASIKKAVADVKANYEEATIKAERLKARIRKDFDMDTNAATLKEAYRQLVSART